MLFHRDLPGGGYVAIHVDQPNAAKSVARIVVERRSDRARRDGHKPPVILERSWTKASDDFGDLYRLANDNVSIAHGLMTLGRAD
jgi:hypothetical protein